jgi:hypothetical protein
MKNPIAYAVWIVAVLIATSILIAGFKEGGANDNIFLTSLYIYFYVYSFSIFWYVLQTHVKLANEIADLLPSKNKLIDSIDELTDEILSNSSYWLLLILFYYWAIRVVLLVVSWLQRGYWVEFNTCDVLPIFCTYQTQAVGFNKIMSWIGYSEFGIFLSVLLLILSWIASKNPKSNLDW